ncbi:MAG TPA: fibronectin type III domain-containing protein, partial [Candidatus Deferrimicrobium sp.]|nr:fibronectin type III domain-containing protein [Candidatus Deferrimicrobium sp.]
GLFTIDSMPPQASSPYPGNYTFSNSPMPSFRVTLIDSLTGVNASSLVLRVNDSPEIYTWDGTILNWTSDTSYAHGTVIEVEIQCEDNVGNAKIYTFYFTIDLVQPQASNQQPTGIIVDSTPLINISLTDNLSGINASSIVIKLDGIQKSPTNWDGINAFYSVSPAYLNSKIVNVEVNVRDNAGNPLNVTWSFIVDLEKPSCNLIYPAGSEFLANGSTISILWAASDLTTVTIGLEYSPNGGTNWYEINGGVYSHLNDGHEDWTLPALDILECSLRINATDQVGRSTIVTVANNFSIDATPPVSPVDLRWTEGEISSDTSIIIQWNASYDSSGIAGYYIQVAENIPDFENNTIIQLFVSGADQCILNELHGIKDGNTYYVRICAQDTVGHNSTWSETSAGIRINVPTGGNLWLYIILAVAAIAGVAVVALVVKSRKAPTERMPLREPKRKGVIEPIYAPKKSIQDKIEQIIAEKIPLESITDPDIIKLLEAPVGGVSLELIQKLQNIPMSTEERSQIFEELTTLSPEEQKEFIEELLKTME